jgi:hypothetical protein
MPVKRQPFLTQIDLNAIKKGEARMLNRKFLSRRQFLQLSATVGASAVLAACDPAGTSQPGASSQTDTDVAPQTQTAATDTEVTPESLADLLGSDMQGSPDHE